MAKATALEKGKTLAIFNKENFYQILNHIESMEADNQNIWVPIGILETMYDDDAGFIDEYFHTDSINRSREKLWNKLNKNFDK